MKEYLTKEELLNAIKMTPDDSLFCSRCYHRLNINEEGCYYECINSLCEHYGWMATPAPLVESNLTPEKIAILKEAGNLKEVKGDS